LEEPRGDNRSHLLLDIIVIAICAAICDANAWTDVELFGQAKEQWFRSFLELPHGIPSHDTFSRVFARIDAEQFQERFRDWIAAVEERTRMLRRRLDDVASILSGSGEMPPDPQEIARLAGVEERARVALGAARRHLSVLRSGSGRCGTRPASPGDGSRPRCQPF